MSEEPILPIPNLKVPEWTFHLSSPTLEHLHAKAREELLKAIEADGACPPSLPYFALLTWIIEMAPYYKLITAAPSPVLPLDEELLKKMESTNENKLKAFEEKLVEAEKIEGESEISEILRAKAMYLTQIGDRVRPPPPSPIPRILY